MQFLQKYAKDKRFLVLHYLGGPNLNTLEFPRERCRSLWLRFVDGVVIRRHRVLLQQFIEVGIVLDLVIAILHAWLTGLAPVLLQSDCLSNVREKQMDHDIVTVDEQPVVILLPFGASVARGNLEISCSELCRWIIDG